MPFLYTIKYCILVFAGVVVITKSFQTDIAVDEEIVQTAINAVHNELDDNKDGQVDVAEAEQLVQDDPDYTSIVDKTDVFMKSLTKETLWKNWKQNEVSNWTKHDVALWIIYDVQLPQYAEAFFINSVDGAMIPRLASNKLFIKEKLKITNAVHCLKICIRAKNLVLFGPSKEFSKTFSSIDKMAYGIISELHSQLDDDKDGGVDPAEADEFARDELKYTSDFDRPRSFNKNDNHISKDELWKNWKTSEVYNWTVDNVIHWLSVYVELPEYTDAFRNLRVNGPLIPRLLEPDMLYLTKDLKIKNPVHRKKIALKATDLILFGSPKYSNSLMKDSLLFTLTFIVFGGCWLAYIQNRYSRKQLQYMEDQIRQLSVAESALTGLQSKLDEAEKLAKQVNFEKLEIEEKLKLELEKYKGEMSRTESAEDLMKLRQLDDDYEHKSCCDMSLPEQLRILLQINYQIEDQFLTWKKKMIDRKMLDVRDMNGKVEKKKNSLFGLLKMAHSGELVDMQKYMSDTKTALIDINNEFEDRSLRWKFIEKLTKFKILPSPDLDTLKSLWKTSMNGNLNRNQSLPSTTSLCTLSNTAMNAAVTLPEPPLPVAAAISAHTNSYHHNNNNSNVNHGNSSNNHHFPNAVTSKLVYKNRPKSLMLCRIGSSGDSFDLTTDTPPASLAEYNCKTDNDLLPKVWSVSSNLYHMYSPGAPSAFNDHHFSSVNSSDILDSYHQLTHPSPTELESKSNVSSRLSKVRPFAFRWLKHVNKSNKCKK